MKFTSCLKMFRKYTTPILSQFQGFKTSQTMFLNNTEFVFLLISRF